MSFNAMSVYAVATPLSVTSVSQPVVISYPTGATCYSYRFANIGTQTVFVWWSGIGQAAPTATSSPTSTTPSIAIPAGNTEVLTGPPNAQIAAVAAGGGSTLYVVAGEGE